MSDIRPLVPLEISARQEAEIRRLRAENADLVAANMQCGKDADEIERLRAEIDRMRHAYDEDVLTLSNKIDRLTAERDKLRAALKALTYYR